MELSIALQTLVFLKAAILGICAGVLYDILRAIRWECQVKTGATAVLDGLFWLIVSAALFLFVVVDAGGDGRGYILLGIGLGMLLYYISLSQVVLTVVRHIVATVLWFLHIPEKIWKRSAAKRVKIRRKLENVFPLEKFKKKLSIFRKKV